jgi:hypothetical protein
MGLKKKAINVVIILGKGLLFNNLKIIKYRYYQVITQIHGLISGERNR